MCRALVTIVFGAAMFGASFPAPAHKIASRLPVRSIAGPEAVADSGRPAAVGACQSTSIVILSKNPVPVQIVPLTYRGTDRIVSVPVQHLAAGQSGDRNSSWRSITALLSTLALIGTIGLRRYKAGKP